MCTPLSSLNSTYLDTSEAMSVSMSVPRDGMSEGKRESAYRLLSAWMAGVSGVVEAEE
jgi:hypothetical protein